MKLFQSIFVLSFLLLISACQDQDKGNKTAEFKVWGNCEMCKETIESSLKKEAGVKEATWDVKSKMMTVNYDSSSIDVNKMHKKIAASGYDTEVAKGDDKAYSSLHVCCKYKRKE
jgi:periplasmic mercuric ion binding protein